MSCSVKVLAKIVNLKTKNTRNIYGMLLISSKKPITREK